MPTKVIRVALLLLLCSISAWAAGGSCPSGSNYLNPATPTNLPLTTLSAAYNVTSCYYFSSTIGSDTLYDGTTEAISGSHGPFAHAPGMPNCTSNCAAVTLSAGVALIGRGGDQWHYSSGAVTIGGTWSLTHGGTSSAYVYVGVDPNWYSGSSFARPVLNGDNPLSTSYVSSCSAAAYSSDRVLINAPYIVFDNFEMTGICWTSTAANIAGMFDIPGGTNLNVMFFNNYCHGWTVPKTASDNFPCVTTFGGGTLADNWQIAYNVFDGSDSPHFPYGDTTDCQYAGLNYVGCASGQGINGSHSRDLHGNIFRYLGNAVVTGNCYLIHDNLWEYIYNTYSGVANPQHPNLLNCLGGTAGQATYFYNNVIRHTTINENFYLPVTTVLYGFGNVSYDNMNSNEGTLPATCIRFNNIPVGNPTVAVYWYNNTDDGTCQLRAATTNAPLTPFDGTISEQGNFFIAYSTTTSNICTGTSCSQFANTHTTEGGATATWGETGLGDVFMDGQGTVTFSGTTLTNHNVGSGSFPFQTGGVWIGGTILVPTLAAAPTTPFNVAPFTIASVASTSSLTTTASMGSSTSGFQYYEHITANLQGFTEVNGYAETATSNTTYQTATNATSSCSTFSPDGVALCNATTFAVTEVPANGGQIASFPAIPAVARPASGNWDAGAYQLTSTVVTPVCSPGNSSYATPAPQTVSCTIPAGSTGCYTINGTVPVAPTPGTCGSNATIYVSSLIIYPSVNLQIIATEVGFINSAIASYNYTSTYAFNADNLYCPTVGCTPTWGVSDGPALLPIAAMNTASANTPSPGSVISVGCSSAALTAALAAPAYGTTIQLTAGCVYSGNFTIGAPSGTGSQSNWLTITTSGLSSLPPQGTRITPCYSGITSLVGRPPYACPVTPGTYTAQIISPNASPALSFLAGEQFIKIVGIEFTRTLGTGFNALLISVGNVGAGIGNIIFDRILCHGDELTDETETCLDLSTVSNIAVVGSYMYDFLCKSPGTCTDSHAIDDGLNNVNSTQESVHKVVNTFLESSGEAGYLSGGGAANTVPSDLEYRLDTVFRPMKWNPNDPNYDGGIGGDPFVVKNLFEFKSMNRAVVEGSIFQNTWGGFSQSGELWKPGFGVNQSGNCPLCADINLTFRYNYGNSAAQFIDGIGTINSAGFYPYADNSDSFHDNLVDNLGYTNSGTETNASMVSMWEAQTISTTAQILHDAKTAHNTMVSALNAPGQYGILGMSGPVSPSALQQYNLHFDNNIGLAQSPYGTGNVIGAGSCANVTGGLPMFNACWYLTSSITGNCFITNGSITWPAGNVTSLANQSSVYTAWNNGNAGNYVVASGACKGSATDGLDPGANLSVLNSVLAGNAAPLPGVQGQFSISVGTTATPGTNLLP